VPICNKEWKEQHFLKDVVFICSMPNWPFNSIHTISSHKNRPASENEIYYVISSSDFLTLALAGGEWSASRPGRFTPGERTRGTSWIGGWLGPSTGLDDVENKEFLTL
jgi:hypothetical protein